MSEMWPEDLLSIIIYRIKPDKATIIAVLLELHLWDAMTIPERQAACERGEIWDTPAGRSFKRQMEEA